MPRPFDLVIFDCDGVLVDSERLAVRVEAELISELGWVLAEEEILERFVGRSDDYMRGEIERVIGHPLPNWQETYEARLHQAFEEELGPVDGIIEALDRIGLPTCVASSGSHEKMWLTLGLTGLRDRFHGRIYSATEVGHGKPAPDLFLHAATALGAQPSRCVVVEDSRSGVEAARAAGMRALGYAGGMTPAAWLEGPNTVVFNTMAELPGLLQAEWPD